MVRDALLTRALIAVTAALVALGVACGDDDSDATPTTAAETPSPTETSSAIITLTVAFPRPTDTGFEFVRVEREVVQTQAVGRAALEQLLAGPTAEEEAELAIMNPIPEGTQLLSLDIAEGTATADFSAELLDYGGGAANVEAITGAITETLRQFPTVHEVVILVEGEPEQLQP